MDTHMNPVPADPGVGPVNATGRDRALAPSGPLALAAHSKMRESADIAKIAPALVREINTNRVPVRQGGIAIAYVKDAQWVDTPDKLFRDLLSETIGARTGRVVLSDQQRTLDPGARLTGQLLAFSIDADRSEAVVTYDAALLRGGGARIETRRSEARVPVAVIDRASVSTALNQAANQVAGDIATWIGG